LGALFSSPPTPQAPVIPAVPPAAAPPIMANANVDQAGNSQKGKAAAAAGAGFSGTVKNDGGAGGLTTPATTAKASLLG